ncbi:hypothetical protein [Rhizobium ruizarguesonis]|jgi:hypothetical protein|uniref:hypothetical protein n=1 Tax=Rhizobium ruizarguesonis TaxID=2081791 RepID=UPI0010300642|nr:hypothetical protein [Rhizobium ruizarguesonis]NEI29663.1 hypothetical protein [Rhizobium ruizarguesonis]TBB91904.1 hypothetical protein ELH38_07325 [Rhizobium ruizarguesonis]
MPHNVEDDFLAAYHRLAAGAPIHGKLRQRLIDGKTLDINQSTVALEAGHSRTLLSQRAPGYERICALLFPAEAFEAGSKLANQTPSQNEPQTAVGKIARLTADNLALTAERDMFATRAAEAYLAISLLRRDLSSLQSELVRRTKIDQLDDTEDYVSSEQ